MTSTDGARERLLARVTEALACPDCRSVLGPDLRCAACGRAGHRTATAISFGGLTEAEEKADWLNAAKAKAKRRLGRLYPVAVSALGPVYGPSDVPRFLGTFDLERDLVCDLGAGARDYANRVVCVDGYAYESVHVVADLTRLPFRDGSLAGVVSEAVLEHVPDPAAHVAEIQRVLRPGGRVHCYFPFIAAFHASPHDYTRYTLPGLKHLFEGFEVERTLVAGGPTSGLVWTLQEWLAIAGSFGSERLYRALVPLTWAISPLKYLDVFLMKHPAAHVIASGFVIEARKPG